MLAFVDAMTLHTHTHTQRSIAVTTTGKQCVLREGALPKLVALLTSTNTEMVLNAIKVAAVHIRLLSKSLLIDVYI